MATEKKKNALEKKKKIFIKIKTMVAGWGKKEEKVVWEIFKVTSNFTLALKCMYIKFCANQSKKL